MSSVNICITFELTFYKRLGSKPKFKNELISCLANFTTPRLRTINPKSLNPIRVNNHIFVTIHVNNIVFVQLTYYPGNKLVNLSFKNRGNTKNVRLSNWSIPA